MAKNYIFTITPGRTGTMFLAELIAQNAPDSEVHHEILGYDSFGVDSPDLSTLTLFNSQGNVAKVKNFWKQKLTRIKNKKVEHYAETSHILAKAGLMENIKYLGKDANVHIVILTRDVIKILESLHGRFDFLNIGDIWLWFLDPNYPIKILDSTPFRYLAVHGSRLWYIYEMLARAQYYKIKFKGNKNVHFHQVDINTLNKKEGADKLLKKLGITKKTSETTIPPKLNTTQVRQLIIDDKTLSLLKKEMEKPFKPKDLAEQFINAGGGWD